MILHQIAINCLVTGLAGIGVPADILFGNCQHMMVMNFVYPLSAVCLIRSFYK